MPQLITEAAALAGRMADAARPLIREVWLAPKQVEYNTDGSLLTKADLGTEELWRSMIREAFPSHGILGEEYGWEGQGSGWTWVLDPIDGTRQFAFGTGNFSTLISLCHEGRPVLGVMDLPLADARFTGIAGQGTELNGRALRVSGQNSLAQAHAGLANHDSFTGGTDAGYEALRAGVRASVFDAGSPAYGGLAAGKIDLCLNGPDLDAYDICALVPIVTGAGGVISSWTGEQLTITSSGCILASASLELHEAALDLLA